MKKLVKKQVVGIIAVLLIGSPLLTACSAKQQQAATKQEVTTETTTETVETAKVEEVVVEPTPEPTPEPKTESKEIDLDSDLPGEKWILNSFYNVIDVPKLVVFNDQTNKKIILEEGQEVEFCKSDSLAVYVPIGAGDVKTLDYTTFNNGKRANPSILNDISVNAWADGSSITQNVVEFNGEELTLTATLIFVE